VRAQEPERKASQKNIKKPRDHSLRGEFRKRHARRRCSKVAIAMISVAELTIVNWDPRGVKRIFRYD